MLLFSLCVCRVAWACINVLVFILAILHKVIMKFRLIYLVGSDKGILCVSFGFQKQKSHAFLLKFIIRYISCSNANCGVQQQSFVSLTSPH